MDATRRERAAKAAAVAPLVLLPVADVALGPDQGLNGSYALAALIAAGVCSVPFTVGVGITSVLLSLASSLWNSDVMAADWGVRLGLCVALAAIAVFLARIRVGREDDLRQMTLIADVAQRALLRQPPDRVGSVALTTRYVSASRLASVGGDLYDVTATPSGVRAVVGDVRGKGLAGVQLAGTVLGAFRRAAARGPSLVEVAQALDAVVAAVASDEEFVTAVLVEFHEDQTLSLISCGHPPPVVVRADGSVSYVVPDQDFTPLGLGPATAVTSAPWPSGARLLLYTDGLIEARDQRGAFFQLDDHLGGLTGGSVEQALDGLVSALVDHTSGEVGDDVALLLAEHADD